MSLPSLIDEINRLFDELVREPWVRPLQIGQQVKPTPGADWQCEVPLPGMEGADFSLSIEGRRLTVAVRWQTSRRRVSRGAEAKSESEETTRQSFLLPADADLSSLEARIETGVLRIRLRLRRQER